MKNHSFKATLGAALVGGSLLAGLGLLIPACGDKASPAAPVTVIVVETPTYPPCVAGGFTCTPSFTLTPSPTFTFTPTNTLSPTTTLTPADWVITSPVTLTTGQYNHVSVHLQAGGVLYISGAVTLNVSGFFSQDAATTVTGDGTGYPVDQGPGTAPVTDDAAGGSHGGAGGADGDGFTVGPANDSSTAPSLMGSGGGQGPGEPPCGGSSGGGLLNVNASGGSATLNGTISMNGADFCGGTAYEGYGGGAGGTLYIQAQTITGNGLLRANGGTGSTSLYNCGGGGGGGIIVLSDHTANNFSGTHQVTGGPAGTGGVGGAAGAGSAGIYNTTTY